MLGHFESDAFVVRHDASSSTHAFFMTVDRKAHRAIGCAIKGFDVAGIALQKEVFRSSSV